MREVCLFSRTTKPKLSFSKDLDYCQKAVDKIDDIDRSSTSHKPRGFYKKQCDFHAALGSFCLVFTLDDFLDKILRRR